MTFEPRFIHYWIRLNYPNLLKTLNIDLYNEQMISTLLYMCTFNSQVVDGFEDI